MKKVDFTSPNESDRHELRRKPFGYAILQPGEFRLALLCPGSMNDEIFIVLTTEDLASTNRYLAVSYCWGSMEKRQYVLCRSQTSCYRDSPLTGAAGFVSSEGRIPITASLDQLLRSLREEDAVLPLWIDALSIDQDNTEEKNSQVRMMHRIYSNAAGTILYVGESRSERATRNAFHAIQRLGRLKTIAPNLRPKAFELDCSSFPTPYGFDSVVNLMGAFEELLSRDWFRRAWILQEIIMSKRRELRCGEWSISWDAVVEACNVVMEDPFLPNGLQQYFQNGSAVCNRIHLSDGLSKCWSCLSNLDSGVPPPDGMSREEFEKMAEQALAFFPLLIISSHLEATDPRDKIFALSNIVFGYSRQQVPQIDYGMSAAEVFVRAALNISNHHPGLQILSLVTDSQETSDLPSWVPDFSIPLKREPFGFRSCQAGGSLTLKPIIPEIPKPFQMPMNLRCDGALLMSVGSLNSGLHCWEDLKALGIDAMLHDTYPTTPETYCKAVTKLIILNPKTIEIVMEMGLDSHFWKYKIAHSQAATSGVSSTHKDPVAPRSKGQLRARARKLLPWRSSDSKHYDKELKEMESCMHEFATTLYAPFSVNRQVMLSELGFLGLVPPGARVGDDVIILFGVGTPFVVRRRDNGSYKMIGECFVYGIMGGEAALDVPPGAIETIVLE